MTKAAPTPESTALLAMYQSGCSRYQAGKQVDCVVPVSLRELMTTVCMNEDAWYRRCGGAVAAS